VALYLGHRRSIDFDWFTPKSIAPVDLLADVRAMGFPVEVIQNTEGTFLATVAGVSFTVFRYKYRLLAPPTKIDGCNVAALPDLAAMKLLAIYQRGTKKDFMDVHELLERRLFKLPDMLQAFREKFGIEDTGELLRALVYFEDAEALPMPQMVVRRAWDEVKAGMWRHMTALTGQRPPLSKTKKRVSKRSKR